MVRTEEPVVRTEEPVVRTEEPVVRTDSPEEVERRFLLGPKAGVCALQS
jgi:hypothetical protein